MVLITTFLRTGSNDLLWDGTHLSIFPPSEIIFLPRWPLFHLCIWVHIHTHTQSHLLPGTLDLSPIVVGLSPRLRHQISFLHYCLGNLKYTAASPAQNWFGCLISSQSNSQTWQWQKLCYICPLTTPWFNNIPHLCSYSIHQQNLPCYSSKSVILFIMTASLSWDLLLSHLLPQECCTPSSCTSHPTAHKTTRQSLSITIKS